MNPKVVTTAEQHYIIQTQVSRDPNCRNHKSPRPCTCYHGDITAAATDDDDDDDNDAEVVDFKR